MCSAAERFEELGAADRFEEIVRKNLSQAKALSAKDSTVVGARMTGGGFGGCTVNVVRGEAMPEVSQSIAAQYQDRTGIEPTVFATRPARGAHIIDETAS